MELRDKNGLTEAEFLARYRPREYARPSVTADIAVFRRREGETELLLIRRGGHPYLGRWALPGGFAMESEPVGHTAARELEEETGLKGLALEPVGLFSDPGRDPRMWVMSEAYAAVIPAGLEPAAGDDAAAAAWFSVTDRTEGETLTLTFAGAGEQFCAHLALRVLPGLRGPRTEYAIRESGGLAFDHAAIIAAALDRAGLLRASTAR